MKFASIIRGGFPCTVVLCLSGRSGLPVLGWAHKPAAGSAVQMGTICNLCMLHQTCFSSYSLPFCGVVSNVDGVWESGGVVRSDRDWINVCCRWTGESWSVKRELFWAMGKRESFPPILSYALSKVFIVRISTCRLSWHILLDIYFLNFIAVFHFK